jgi:hypothetical protein
MLAAGTVAPIVIKTGPSISRAFSAASSVFPLIIAPGMIVSIYGNLLAAGTERTTSAALPLQLSDSQVMLGGTPIPMYYGSPSHINVVIPENASGLARLGVHNTSGLTPSTYWLSLLHPPASLRTRRALAPPRFSRHLTAHWLRPTTPFVAGTTWNCSLPAWGRRRRSTVWNMPINGQQPRSRVRIVW